MTNPDRDELVKLADLRSANVARQKEWDAGNQITLAYRGNELAGEVGEACNVIKKLERERLGIAGSRDTVAHLAEELADVVICADLIAMQAGIDLLGEAVPAKFNATSEKVGLNTRLYTAPPADAGMREALDAIAPAVENLACHQEQCDRDGIMVKVSRQALDEVLNAINTLALTAPGATTKSDGGDPTSVQRQEAMRLLKAEDDRQLKLHDLLETIREQIRIGVEPQHRPEGLFKNIQDAVYAMRGRTPLMNDAAITCVLVDPSDPSSTRSEVTVPCGLDRPSESQCLNMKEVGGGMDGERYSCAVCGKGYYLDYDDMR